MFNMGIIHYHHRQLLLAVEGCSIAPTLWPHLTTCLHSLHGGQLESLRTWSTRLFLRWLSRILSSPLH